GDLALAVLPLDLARAFARADGRNVGYVDQLPGDRTDLHRGQILRSLTEGFVELHAHVVALAVDGQFRDFVVGHQASDGHGNAGYGDAQVGGAVAVDVNGQLGLTTAVGGVDVDEPWLRFHPRRQLVGRLADFVVVLAAHVELDNGASEGGAAAAHRLEGLDGVVHVSATEPARHLLADVVD